MNQEHTGQGAEDKGFFPEKNILPPRQNKALHESAGLFCWPEAKACFEAEGTTKKTVQVLACRFCFSPPSAQLPQEVTLPLRRISIFCMRICQFLTVILAMASLPIEGEPTNSICRELKMFVILKFKKTFWLQLYSAPKLKVVKPPNGP